MRARFTASLCVGASLLATPAASQQFDSIVTDAVSTIGNLTDTLVPDGFTNFRVGVGAVMSPDFQGADSYDVGPFPLISFRFRDIVSVDNNKVRVHVLSRNSLFDSDRFRAGPVIKLDFGRDVGDSADLMGLSKVGFGVEMGGHVSYTWDSFRASVEIRQAVSGHDGFLVDLGLNTAIFQSDQLSIGGGLQGTFASNSYMDSYFSITAAEATASGLAAFDAGSGIKDVGLGFAADYRITDHWSIISNLGYKRLLGDASDSPLVTDRGSSNQFSAGTFVVYTF